MRYHKLLSVLAIVLIFSFSPSISSAAPYDLYHIAVRDFNGDGIYNKVDGYDEDRVRVGFTGPDQYYSVTAFNSSNESIFTGSKSVGYKTMSSYDYGDTSFHQESYFGFNIFEGPTTVNKVLIQDSSANQLGLYENLNLPSDLSSYAYNGPDMKSLQTSKVAGGWQFSWDTIANPNENGHYRFTMYAGDYEIMRRITDPNVTSLIIPDELFAEAGGNGIVWALGFQERFYVEGHDFGELVRSYCPTEGEFVPTPIPAGVWLLGSGLIGLIGVRRRFNNN